MKGWTLKTIHDPRYIRLIEQLKRRRLALGLTQTEVATNLGWQRTVLSNIETRERRLDTLEFFLLARLYGIKLSDLRHVIDQT
jgi:transcriptional regulator with XRE-family HTH domain